jgi:crotonobetainyl-CoA:carnitine CoA-transferase CaiB-like acyl-CoA transferase
VRIGPGAIDMMTGALAFGAINGALYHRQRTGEGQSIECSLYDTSISLLNYSAVEYAATGHVQEPSGGQHPHIAPYEVFTAQDRYFFLGVANDRHFERFCDHFGFPELKADPGFATNAQRVRDRVRLKQSLEARFKEKPAQHWVSGCEAIGIPSTLIRRVDEATDDPHAVARGAIVPVPGMGHFRMPGVPIHFEKTPGEVRGEPPTAGRDTRVLLRELGYDAQRVGALLEKGVVVQGEDTAEVGLRKDR